MNNPNNDLIFNDEVLQLPEMTPENIEALNRQPNTITEKWAVLPTRLEQLKEKYKDVIFHKAFHFVDTELIRAGFKGSIHGFIQGGSFFLFYTGLHSRVLLQMTTGGKTLDVFQEIDLCDYNDILDTIKRREKRHNVIHTLPEVEKPKQNILSRIGWKFINWSKNF